MDFLRSIPIFLILFIAFIIITNVVRRKSDRAQKDSEDEFWERERQANATRRKDISSLPYITIPVNLLPEEPDSDAAKALLALSSEKILNLTGQSNTDLKLEYGAANLEELSACDNRFTELVTNLVAYTGELIDADKTEEAQALLEFAVSIQADAKPIYIRLARIYSETGVSHKISELITSAEELPTLSKQSIIDDLKRIG